jgi:hypothetical protein
MGVRWYDVIMQLTDLRYATKPPVTAVIIIIFKEFATIFYNWPLF